MLIDVKKRGSIKNSIHFQSNLLATVVTSVILVLFVKVYSRPLLKIHSPSPESRKQIEIKWSLEPPELNTKELKKFVEANPNSAANPPDKTQNFSFRDQQAAQPKKTDSKELKTLPKVDGNENSTKIVPSHTPSPESRPPVKQELVKKKLTKESQVEAKAESKAQKANKSKFEESQKPKSHLGLIEEKSNMEIKDRVIDLTKKNKSTVESKQLAMVYPKTPKSAFLKPRPKLSPELLAGPLMKTSSNAPRVGSIAIESRLHPYGVYVQEMLKSIEDQWHHLAADSLSFIQRDKLNDKITYRFTLLADGSIKNLERKDKGENYLPAELCRQAIASRVPYGNWTQEMINDFGQSDVITINFNYR